MAWESWACYSGVEIVNTARASAYASQHGLDVRCSGDTYILDALGHGSYSSPDGDDAPWYDPAEPDSKSFLGVVGVAIDGTGGTGTSGWTDLLGDGARPGPVRRGAREVEFTVTLIGADQAGLSYGLGWLAAALRGDLCDTECDADSLTVLAAAPQPPATSCHDNADEPLVDAEARGDHLERHLYRCRVLEGPTVSSRKALSRGVVAEVTFVIKAGIPHWYARPQTVWKLSDTDPADYWTAVVGPWNSQYVYEECADDVADSLCLTPPADPNYPCPPLTTPVYPTPPRDPCYQGDHYHTGWRTLYRVPAGLAGQWFEKAPIFRFINGVRQTRSLLLRWYQNPLNREPRPENLDVCSVCAELWIPYLPPYAELFVDSRTQRATVTCANGAMDEPILYGAFGGVYTWPVLECSTALMLEMVVDGRYGVSDGLDLHFQLAERRDAS